MWNQLQGAEGESDFQSISRFHKATFKELFNATWKWIEDQINNYNTEQKTCENSVISDQERNIKWKLLNVKRKQCVNPVAVHKDCIKLTVITWKDIQVKQEELPSRLTFINMATFALFHTVLIYVRLFY